MRGEQASEPAALEFARFKADLVALLFRHGFRLKRTRLHHPSISRAEQRAERRRSCEVLKVSGPEGWNDEGTGVPRSQYEQSDKLICDIWNIGGPDDHRSGPEKVQVILQLVSGWFFIKNDVLTNEGSSPAAKKRRA